MSSERLFYVVTGDNFGKSMRSQDFFAQNPVFTFEEFATATGRNGERSIHTIHNRLAQHVAAGHILHVRRRIYATVPRGVKPENAPVDPYLLACKLSPDAVVAYHAALQFHGYTYSVWRRFHYLTRYSRAPFNFRDSEFIPVRAPAAIRYLPDLGGYIDKHSHTAGLTRRPRDTEPFSTAWLMTRELGLSGVVRATSLERTLVDLLNAPDRGGGWEEIWRSLEMVPYFNVENVIDYAIQLGSALTIARVGFFLEEHKGKLLIDLEHIDRLRSRAPAQPRYLERNRQERGKLVPGWNLIVPERILQRAWEETR